MTQETLSLPEQFTQLINQFNEQLKVAISEMGIQTSKDPTVYKDLKRAAAENYFGTGLPIDVPIECSFDAVRTLPIAHAIHEAALQFIDTGEMAPTVLDMGAGTGLLSYLTMAIFTSHGLNPTIIAVEIEEQTHNLAAKMFHNLGLSDITLIQADGAQPGYLTPETVIDLFLNENLSAGLFEEHEMQLLLQASNHFHESTILIPQQVDLAFHLETLDLNSWPSNTKTVSRLSAPNSIPIGQQVHFATVHMYEVAKSGNIPELGSLTTLALPSGSLVNAIAFSMATRFGVGDNTILHPNTAHSLGNDEVMLLNKSITVNSSREVLVEFAYLPGTPAQTVQPKISVTNV